MPYQNTIRYFIVQRILSDGRTMEFTGSRTMDDSLESLSVCRNHKNRYMREGSGNPNDYRLLYVIKTETEIE